MGKEVFVHNDGGAIRSLVRQYGVSGKLEHYRKVSEDLTPHVDRAASLAKLKPGKEYRYEGSVPRIVIDDWLRKNGKTWRDWAIDKEIKAKFLLYFRTEYSKMAASTYRERSLAVNRATAPKFGAKVLSEYRKELQIA